jgi:hypothetical protein
VALIAIAAFLVGLHLARVGAIFIHADGRGDAIPDYCFQQLLKAFASLDLNELGELRSTKGVIHVLLLATGARAVRAAEREGEAGFIVAGG